MSVVWLGLRSDIRRGIFFISRCLCPDLTIYKLKMIKRIAWSLASYRLPSQLSPFAVFLFTCLSLVLVDCDLCFTTQNLTKSTLNCIYTYSYQCSPTPTLLSFQGCTYDSCLYNNSTNNCTTIKTNSTDFVRCSNICNTVSSSSNNQWTSILLIVLSIILLFIICYCIVRKCRGQPRDEFRVGRMVEGQQEGGLASQRQLNRVMSNEITLQWLECSDSSKWAIQEETCAICLDKDLNCILPCNHYFHSICIKQWLNVKQFCPICKSEAFTQLKILCKSCKKQQLICPVIHYTRVEIPDICPTCL